MHEIGARVEDPMMAGALVPRQDLTDAYFGERAACWNEIYAEGGLQGLVYRKRMQAALAWIDALGLAPGSKVLEVGCGAGFATLELARRGYAVHSSDSSADMVALASTGSPRPASEMLLSPSPTCTTSPMAPGASSWSSRSASCPGCIPRSARWGRSRGCLRPAATRSLYKLLDVNARVSGVFRLFEGTNQMDVARVCYPDLTGQEVPVTALRPRRKW